MSKDFKRAKSAEQKAVRVEGILAAAERLFEQNRFEKVTLNDVAASIGITKAALYRYFRTKEALFLALFEREFARLIDTIKARHHPDAAVWMSEALLAHPMYCQLSAILHTVLENNVSQDEVAVVKRALLMGMQDVALILVEKHGFNEQTAMDRLFQVQQVVIGAWHVSHPSEVVAAVVKEGDLQVFDLNYPDVLKAHLRLIFP